MISIKNIFPLTERLKTYNKSDFRGDLNAGLTVGVMLIPQGMAYAVLAGLPPVYGLYAAIIPLFIYGLLGSSRELAVGPVAMVSLLVLAGVGQFAEPGSERFIQLAILTALGVGVVQLIMGALRMGFLVNFLSHPVLSGFTSAAAIIIGASQIKNLFGMELPRTNQMHELAMAIAQNIQTFDVLTAVFGIGAIISLIALKRWKKTFPAALVVVILGIVITALGGLDARGVSIVGNIPKGFPAFSGDFLNVNDVQLLLPIILVIALVSYMESIAVAKAIATKNGYKVDPNQELVALGTANIGGSFFQAFPTTGGFSRTAVNDQTGANSGIASLISAGVIVLTVLFLTPLFYYLPGAVLAAIIIMAVKSLFDYAEMKYLWQTDKKDFVMLMITFLVTLFVGIEEGIALGVIISLISVIYTSTKPHSTELGRLGNSRTYRNIDRYSDAIVDEDVLIFRFDSQLYFANADNFSESIELLLKKRGDKLRCFVLDASSITDIDSTGMHIMEQLVKDLRDRNIAFKVASVRGPVRDKLKRSGIIEHIGHEHFYLDVADAADACKGIEKQQKFTALQSNY